MEILCLQQGNEPGASSGSRKQQSAKKEREHWEHVKTTQKSAQLSTAKTGTIGPIKKICVITQRVI